MIFARIRKYILSLLLKIMPNMAFFSINRSILNIMGHEIAKSVRIWSSIEFLGTSKFIVGDETFVGHRCILSGNDCTITIGKFCDISSNVSFVAGTHKIDLIGSRIAGEGFSMNITVGNRVWIGYGSIILGGVVIGDNVIIGAGSVVNKNIPSNTIYGGVPAKMIRQI